MTQPLRDLPVHRRQSTTTPIGPRGKKGRVGDPGEDSYGDVATPETSENSWPASRLRHGDESPATDGLDTDPNPTPLWLPHGTARWRDGDGHRLPAPPTEPKRAGCSSKMCAPQVVHEPPAPPTTNRCGPRPQPSDARPAGPQT